MRLFYFTTLLFISIIGNTQNFNYWSTQHGVKATFLAGAAYGTVDDNIAVIYNPASISFIDNSSLSLSANTVSLRILNFKDALGKNVDLNNIRFSIMPQLLAGVVDFRKAPKLKLGYMVASMTDFKSDFSTSTEGQSNIVDSIPGDEAYYSKYRAERYIIESKIGFALSYLINAHISVGGSFIVGLRTDRFLNNVNMKISPLNDAISNFGSIGSSVDLDYFHFKGVFKPSFALRYDKFKFGISFSLPSFSIFGRGKITREIAIYNFPVYPQNNYLFTDEKSKIKAHHKDPASISFSLAGRISKNDWLSISGAYYFKLPTYYIFNEENEVRTIPNDLTKDEIKSIFGEENFISLKESRSDVFNFGIAYDHKFKNLLELMIGVRTDFSYSIKEDRYYEIDKVKITGAGLNTYYISVGVAAFGNKINKFSVGIDFGFTTNVPVDEIVNITNPTVDQILSGNIKQGNVSQYIIRLSLALDLNFSKKEK